MRVSHAQFFVAYLAQGMQRVGKDYLRTQASTVLGGDVGSLQLLYNLLPEFGSLPWTAKPVLMLLAERNLQGQGRCRLAGSASLITGLVWGYLACAVTSPAVLLGCTGLVSLSSAVVDGLVDGRVAEESVDSEQAAACRYLCECGAITGGLVIGALAWLLTLQPGMLLLLTAGCWVAVAPVAVLAGPRFSAASKGADAALASSWRQGLRAGIDAMANRNVALVSILTFLVCLCPSLDFFLFRQHVLALSASEQTLVSVMGSCGWFLGTSFYRHYAAKGRPVHASLRLCLLLWPLSAFVAVFAAAVARLGLAGLGTAALEQATTLFCKAMTFMPSTVLMQMHAPHGCESTGFALMQWSGTIGQVLSRNVEYSLMRRAGVAPERGAAGFEGFPLAVAAATTWRVCTALVLLLVLVPELARLEAARASAPGGGGGDGKPAAKEHQTLLPSSTPVAAAEASPAANGARGAANGVVGGGGAQGKPSQGGSAEAAAGAPAADLRRRNVTPPTRGAP